MAPMAPVERASRSGTALLAAIASAVLVATLAITPAGASPPGSPTLRLFAVNRSVTLQRTGDGPVPLDIGIFVAALGGNFDVRATRADYDSPIVATRFVNGSPAGTLPSWVATDWVGLSNFLNIRIRSGTGTLKQSQTLAFCPDSYDRQRLNDTGPVNPTYPSQGCYASPFTLGMVWGLDQGWAVDPVLQAGYYGYGLAAPARGHRHHRRHRRPPAPPGFIGGPDGNYTVRVFIPDSYRSLFGIAGRDSSVKVNVTLQTVKRCTVPTCYGAVRAGASRSRSAVRSRPERNVPTVSSPDPASLPDLRSLPAWSINLRHTKKGHDLMQFAATVWDAGPGPMVVEGFRRPNAAVMDAYQYFYKNGNVVGRAPAGTMEYDARKGHQHWHFLQFAQYSLLDSSKSQVLVSGKEGFCLAPTDGIDLTAPGANWNPSYIGFGGSTCGGPNSIWTRETLDAGWGDTYYQYLPGQSFDVTRVPNGAYYVRVTANPLGDITESDTHNDTSLRKVILGGRPGHRTVKVPPWHGIGV